MKVQFARYFCEDQQYIDLLRVEHPDWSEGKAAASQLKAELLEQGVTTEIDVATYRDDRKDGRDIYVLVGEVNVDGPRLQQAYDSGVAGMWDVMCDLSKPQCKARSTMDSETNQWICQLSDGHSGPHRWPEQAYEPGQMYGPPDPQIFYAHRIGIAKGADTDVVLCFPSGKEITIQVRYSNGDVHYEGSLDIILPKPTLVTVWTGEDMETSQAPNKDRQHERIGSQLVLEIP